MVRARAHGWVLLFVYLLCWSLPTYFLKSSYNAS